MDYSSTVRPSPIAGTWYPSNPTRLAAVVDEYIEQASVAPLDGEPVGIITPHAGYRYSGRTAGHAFRTLCGLEVDLVAALSPFHNYHPEPILTTAHCAFWTPLGEIPVDREAVESLNDHLIRECGRRLTPLVNDPEHSLEIELPFLQRSLKGHFKLLPVMVRPLSENFARTLGTCLASVLKGRRALLVASTDLSHFYPEEDARMLDRAMLKAIADFSPEGALRAEESGTGFACGVHAVSAVLWAAELLGANHVRVLHHSTSAEETGDRSSVVGYGAAVILRRP